MHSGGMRVQHVLRRTREEVGATREIARCVGWRDALSTFVAKVEIQILSRNGFKETSRVERRLLRKHSTVLAYLELKLGKFLATYDYTRVLSVSDPALEDKIWVCWWQGPENAPEIVRASIESIRRNAGSHQVIVVTERNFQEYVSLPSWLLERAKSGEISTTHLSDILRVSLLAEHGGLWLDSTFFCSGDLEDLVFSKPLFSIRRPGYLHISVACGEFAGYALACDREHRRVFATVRDFLLEYWRRSHLLIDYLLIDYMIALAQRHDPYIAGSFAKVQANSPCCDELYKLLGEKFDESVWRSISSETSLFKLTWKQEFESESGGQHTFYGALLSGRLC